MIRGIDEMSGLSALSGPVNVAIGIFDGVHHGHCALVRAVTQRAGTPAVLTFVPHPAEVLGAGGLLGKYPLRNISGRCLVILA